MRGGGVAREGGRQQPLSAYCVPGPKPGALSPSLLDRDNPAMHALLFLQIRKPKPKTGRHFPKVTQLGSDRPQFKLISGQPRIPPLSTSARRGARGIGLAKGVAASLRLTIQELAGRKRLCVSRTGDS